jgi:hypothetical protein
MLQGVHELEVAVVALVAKLVARETKDGQLVGVLVRQGVQLNEVPDGRASESGDVVDEHDLALQLSEVKLGSIGGGSACATAESLALEVVEGGHGTNRGALRNRMGGTRGGGGKEKICQVRPKKRNFGSPDRQKFLFFLRGVQRVGFHT